MPLVKLTQGFSAIVDDEDLAIVSKIKWQAQIKGDHVIAKAHRAGASVNAPKILMHRLILGAKSGEMVDHINGNSLDNRRSNLRLATHKTNGQNRSKQRNNTTGFKGVNKYRNGKFRASIVVNRKSIHLGYFSSAMEAS